jgi:hypothetical protein
MFSEGLSVILVMLLDSRTTVDVIDPVERILCKAEIKTQVKGKS